MNEHKIRMKKTQEMIDGVIVEIEAEKAAYMIEELTKQRDAAIKHIAEWCVAVNINGCGWDDRDEYYKDAMYNPQALPEIRELLDTAIKVALVDRTSP